MGAKNFHTYKPEYCCIDLLRAVEAQIFTEVNSGILYYDKNHSGCGSEVRIRFCPFCGAEIITHYQKEGVIWSWETRKTKLQDTP